MKVDLSPGERAPMPMGAVWAFAAGNAGAEVGEAEGGGRILGPGRRPRQHLGLLQHPFQCQDEHASRKLLRVKLGERPASKSQRFLPRRDRATGTSRSGAAGRSRGRVRRHVGCHLAAEYCLV